MMRLAAAVLLGTLLLLGGGRASCGEGVSNDLRYWYLDIYEPLFRVEADPAPAFLVNARKGSRAN